MKLVRFSLLFTVLYLGSFFFKGPKYSQFAARLLCWALSIDIKISCMFPLDHFIFSNHQGWVDCLVLGSLLPVRFIAKSEISKYPFIGRVVANSQALFVIRGKNLDYQAHLKDDVLSSKYPVVCFPEGTTNERIGKLKRGFIEFVEKQTDLPAIAVFLNFEPQEPALFTRQETLSQSFWKLVRHKGNLKVDVEWTYIYRENGKFSEQILVFFKTMEESMKDFREIAEPKF